MNEEYLALFGGAVGIIAFLIWMLFSLKDQKKKKEENRVLGKCPLCDQGLRRGERLRSDVEEIGDIEVRTKIKGCPFCMPPYGERKRTCPVCKARVPQGKFILALSDPRIDRKKLGIRGCEKCYPQGF